MNNLSLFKKNGKFLMLALDHRDSFKKLFSSGTSDVYSDEDLIKVKSEIIEIIYDQVSGLLVDIQYGLPALNIKLINNVVKEKNKPFLLPVEKSGCIEKDGERINELEYSVHELKDMGASGIKLLLYFNPYSLYSSKQLDTAKKILLDCKNNQLPIFLELVTYHNDNSIEKAGNLVIESVTKFVNENIIPDVFKLEYPGDESSCQTLTHLLGDTPWILLTRGESFDAFKLQLKSAITNGCSGFLAGRALWQDLIVYPREERKRMLTNILKIRFQDITEMASKG